MDGPVSLGHSAAPNPELAAIQGFPERYRFAGHRRDRVRQIGNAVPPKMAAAVVSKVLEAIHVSAPGARRLRCVSLFSGCGGLDLGLSYAGFTTLGAVDVDKHCVRRASRPTSPTPTSSVRT